MQLVGHHYGVAGVLMSDNRSGRIEARIGLRMMPTFPRSPLSFRTAGFPQYGWRAGFPSGAFPVRPRLGPPTVIVASGGKWTDPATGQIFDKLHLHWRLRTPA